jgi:putative flippase GtrA
MVKFGITGLLNTGVGLGAIYALKWFWEINDTPANAAGYAVGLLFSLVVNSRWTFRSRQKLLIVAPKYLLVIAVAYALNLTCVKFFIHHLQINSYLAQAIGIAPYTAFTYSASRWWIFRRDIQHDGGLADTHDARTD